MEVGFLAVTVHLWGDTAAVCSVALQSAGLSCWGHLSPSAKGSLVISHVGLPLPVSRVFLLTCTFVLVEYILLDSRIESNGA